MQEQFYIVYLNRASEVIAWHCIATGTSGSVLVDIKLAVAIALNCMACKIMVAHNHPGGVHRASESDIEVTRKLQAAAALFDIAVMDHLIITNSGFYSMRQHKLMIV